MIKREVLALVLVSILITTVPAAAAITEADARHFLLDVYNPNAGKLSELPFVKGVFGNQIINVAIDKPAGKIELIATTDSNGLITNLTSGKSNNATLWLRSDEATVEKIINSADPVKETQKEWGKGITWGTADKADLGLQIQSAILHIVEFFAKLFGVI